MYNLIKYGLPRSEHEKKKDTGKPNRVCEYLGDVSYTNRNVDNAENGLEASKIRLKNLMKKMFADNTRDASELQWKVYEYEKAQENGKCPYKSKEELDEETEGEIKLFNQLIDMLE